MVKKKIMTIQVNLVMLDLAPNSPELLLLKFLAEFSTDSTVYKSKLIILYNILLHFYVYVIVYLINTFSFLGVFKSYL